MRIYVKNGKWLQQRDAPDGVWPDGAEEVNVLCDRGCGEIKEELVLKSRVVVTEDTVTREDTWEVMCRRCRQNLTRKAERLYSRGDSVCKA